jgi:hypothetical protein
MGSNKSNKVDFKKEPYKSARVLAGNNYQELINLIAEIKFGHEPIKKYNT